jgi:aryl-alcohol dehydrogenase-like predicted oxidoreductase
MEFPDVATMKIPRREFIGKSAAGLGGLLLGSRLLALADEPKKFAAFERVPLGKTGLKPTRLCMGTGVRASQRESQQTRLGREQFEALIASAYERGVRIFDLADLYGSHSYLMPALKGKPREDFLIASKLWWSGGGVPEPERPDAATVVSRFLKEIKTDHLDILLLHCVTSPNWPSELRGYMDDLTKLKEKGVIRALGVSCHSLAALEAAASEPWVEVVYARINHTGASMDAKPDKVVPVLKKIHAAGKGVVGMKLIGEGRFRNSEELRNEAVKFVLGLGCVDVLNVGFEKLAEIDDFAARVGKVPLASA